MEIGMRPEMHTYAGGLGVLAGDTARSCAELKLQAVFVTLVSRAGYFRQRIYPERGPVGRGGPVGAGEMVRGARRHGGGADRGTRPVGSGPWLFLDECPRGHRVPVLLLDDLDQNASEDRMLTNHL
jgi:starch phosphorylase